MSGVKFTTTLSNDLSSKLYRQNVAKYLTTRRILGRCFVCCTCRRLPTVSATVTMVQKYTIVELTHDGKHYHGLAVKADCDVDNDISGIAIAYNRAFKAMCGVL